MQDQVRSILGEHGRLPINPADIAENDDLYSSGLSSHSSVHVMLAIEDVFGVEFPDEYLRKSTFESIAAIVRAVKELQAAQ